MRMRDGDLERVRALPLFSGCSDDTFRTLSSVELEGTWNDKETTLAVLKPVSTFILAAVVLDADGLMSARTVERSDILMLSGAAIRRVMTQDAPFACAVAQE